MNTFSVVEIGNLLFRCVLGDRFYFDFSICQFELFGYEDFFCMIKKSTGANVYDLNDRKIGDVVSVRYSNEDKIIWVLIRNKVSGEVFLKKLD